MITKVETKRGCVRRGAVWLTLFLTPDITHFEDKQEYLYNTVQVLKK